MTDGLTLTQVRITRQGAPLIAVDDHIRAGEVLTVMGPSGVGKSTLLAAITGHLPDGFEMTGKITLNGRDITTTRPDKRRVGILFQDDVLFPHMSVAGNLGFALPAHVKDRKTRVSVALSDIGMAGFEARDPATLSGGQKARVALMRMLLSEPEALLLDEPFSRLDAELRDQIRTLVFDLARARGLPVLLVTHDIADAEAAAGRIVTLT